jgi:hypothetical protein
MKATYTKLRDGTWGIKTVGGCPAKGATVAVAKKDGSSKSEVVASVLWRGNDEQGRVCALAKITAVPARQSRGEEEGYNAAYCGYSCPVSGLKCCAKNGPCHDCQ